jgi:hypothetical protein
LYLCHFASVQPNIQIKLPEAEMFVQNYGFEMLLDIDKFLITGIAAAFTTTSYILLVSHCLVNKNCYKT